MTAEEAISCIKYDMAMLKFDPLTGIEYTLEQIKNRCEDNYNLYIAEEMAIEALKEVEQYRALGTVEELKEARESRQAKRIVDVVGHFFTETYDYDYSSGKCPNCKKDLSFDEYYRPLYCSSCGQKFDYGDDE